MAFVCFFLNSSIYWRNLCFLLAIWEGIGVICLQVAYPGCMFSSFLGFGYAVGDG